MKIFQKWFFLGPIAILMAAESCNATPIVGPDNLPTETTIVADTASMATPKPASTLTITETSTITATPTQVPDVELAQINFFSYSIFSEIINHLSVPVIFEDQQPAFRFDTYDPLLDEHFRVDLPIDRYHSISTIPCVLYPGEKAFLSTSYPLVDWSNNSPRSPADKLLIKYQSLGVARPDWTYNGTHYKVWDEKWNIQGNLLNFSFRHDPVNVVRGVDYYLKGTMGLYDKDGHLLGVAGGNIHETAETGIADDYWISLDNSTVGENPFKAWGMSNVKDLPDRLDHLNIMIEVLAGYDGVCRHRLPTATP